MTIQEEFVLTLEASIRAWQDTIDALERKFETALPDARTELVRRIEEFRHRQLDARLKLQEYHDRASGPAQDREAREHAEEVLRIW